MPTPRLSDCRQASEISPIAVIASMIRSSSAASLGPTAEFASGMKIRAAPKLEKPRAGPAMKAEASRNSSSFSDRPASSGWKMID
jgi:hypothetical protein